MHTAFQDWPLTEKAAKTACLTDFSRLKKARQPAQ
jgi:hypothetical protein